MVDSLIGYPCRDKFKFEQGRKFKMRQAKLSFRMSAIDKDKILFFISVGIGLATIAMATLAILLGLIGGSFMALPFLKLSLILFAILIPLFIINQKR